MGERVCKEARPINLAETVPSKARLKGSAQQCVCGCADSSWAGAALPHSRPPKRGKKARAPEAARNNLDRTVAAQAASQV